MTVLDSFALLAFLRGEPGSEKVRRLLERAIDQGHALHMTELNYAEVKYIVLRREGAPGWAQVERGLAQLPIQFHPITRELADLVADIKARFALSLADACAAALAKAHRGEVVTGDREFEPLAGEIKIRWV